MNVFARLVRPLVFSLPLLALLAVAASAQESDVKKFAVDVKLEPAAHAATVRTTFTLWNPTDAPKRNLQFRINGGSEVRSVTLGGQAATFDAKDDKRYTGLKVVTVQLPAPIPGKGTGEVTVESRLTLATGTPDATISPGETVLLPSSLWVPLVSTPYVQYGANTAPYTVTASAGPGEKVVSGGTSSGSTFSQTFFGVPFLVAGSFDTPIARTASGVSLEAWIPEGAPAAERAGAERLLGEAEKIAAYYTKVLGPAPATTFRIIASEEGAGFSSASGVTVGRRVFLRQSTDAETFELLADAVARVWTEGVFAVRGAVPGPAANKSAGVAIVRDALPRYLALLAVGDRFGAAAESAAFDRVRLALLRMGDVAAQVQLSNAIPVDPSYLGLITSKGPIALRIIERETGRDQMLAAIRTATTAARTNGYLTAEELRAAITKNAGRDLSPVYASWLDTVVQPDIIIGVPQQAGGSWTSALRNLGAGDVTVDVVAVTDSGKRLTSRVTVPSQGFGQAKFETTEKITSVEVDPEHVIPQTNYANDARPVKPDPDSLFIEGVEAIKRKEFGPAEEKLHQAVMANPTNATYKAWHSRALLGLGRTADAAKAANDALAAEPVPLDAAAWANNVLGQIAAAGGDAKEAADRFGRASVYAAESSAIKTARDGRIAAERAGGASAAVDDSVVKFFGDFDRAVSARVNTQQAEQFVDAAALPDFVKGLVTSLQQKWSTEVLRTEATGRDETLADARFTVTTSGKTNVARAVVRLRRIGDAWKLVDVQLLETTENEQ